MAWGHFKHSDEWEWKVFFFRPFDFEVERLPLIIVLDEFPIPGSNGHFTLDIYVILKMFSSKIALWFSFSSKNEFFSSISLYWTKSSLFIDYSKKTINDSFPAEEIFAIVQNICFRFWISGKYDMELVTKKKRMKRAKYCRCLKVKMKIHQIFYRWLLWPLR